jgi:DNA ligase-1
VNRFAALFHALDTTTRTGDKVEALARHFREVPEEDRVWTIALLSGRRPRRAVGTGDLRLWAAEAAGIPDWLLEEAYAVTGDLAETIAALLPPASGTAPPLPLAAMMAGILALPALAPPERRAWVEAQWQRLPATERFLFNKLLTGGFRMGVAQGLMTRALARATGLEEAALAHRLTGAWDPATTPFAALVAGGGDAARPYPFALASPLEAAPETLGDPALWLAEWKWDGIRVQVVARGGVFALWSRGEDLVTDRFPDLAALARVLPAGTVLDAELLAWPAGAAAPLPFAALQTRIGRKTVGRAALAAAPARLVVYDLPEAGGEDLRALPLASRRAEAARLIAALPPGLPLALSPEIGFADWPALAAARDRARAVGAEGVMVKRRAGPYPQGRRRGEWWKWKLDPYSVDAVLVYAQAGHGRRAGLYSDFTFALRDGEALVPFAKAYSGLTDAEFAEITRWVQRHTLERFGPVRRVPPELVFEIGFEGIQPSPRHKAGLAVRFPRMLRWRRDKRAEEIDTMDRLRAMLAGG